MPSTMTADDIDFHLQWRAASGHPGGWRVCRQDFRPGADPYLQQLEKSNGQVRLWRSHEAAKRAANRINSEASK